MSIHKDNKRIYITLNRDLIDTLQKEAVLTNKTVSNIISDLIKKNILGKKK